MTTLETLLVPLVVPATVVGWLACGQAIAWILKAFNRPRR